MTGEEPCMIEFVKGHREEKGRQIDANHRQNPNEQVDELNDAANRREEELLASRQLGGEHHRLR